MKQLIILIFILAVGAGSCQNKPKNTPTSQTTGTSKVIPAQQYAQALPSAKQIIDVRTPDEFASGHLAHAQNIDVNSSTFETQIQQLDKTQPLYIYCRSGARSSRATQILIQNGFTQVIDLQGGILSWQAAGLPTE